jgi:hypothetical protein
MNYEKRELYRAHDETVFELLSTYCPNEEGDAWVTYRNIKTKQEYSCRKEAFLSRYSPTP